MRTEAEKRQWVEDLRAKAKANPERARRLIKAIFNMCAKCGGALDEPGHADICAEREAELDAWEAEKG